MTQPEIEPMSPRPLANTLPTRQWAGIVHLKSDKSDSTSFIFNND